MNIKSILSVLAAAILLVSIGRSDDDLTRQFSQTVDFESGGYLQISTYKGSIHLSPWDRNQIEVKAEIVAPEDVSKEYGRLTVEATRIDITGNPKALKIRSNYDAVPEERGFLWSSKTNPYIHYHIRAPRELELKIDDHKSDLKIAGFEGRFDLSTYKGTLEGRDLVGDIRLESYKGRLELTNLAGQIEAETYKGEIFIDSARIDGDSRLETGKGLIEIGLSSSQGFSIYAKLGKRADFRCDFELNEKRSREGRFRADINGGGPELMLRSDKGDIRLRKNS